MPQSSTGCRGGKRLRLDREDYHLIVDSIAEDAVHGATAARCAR